MTALDTVLMLTDRALQVLVPPARNRVCYRSLPDFSDNAYYVFRHALKTRNNLEHVWIVLDLGLAARIEREFEETVRRAGTRGNSVRVVHRRTLEGYWAYLRSRWVFHTHGVYRISDWAFRRSVICLWHGMPIKCIGRLNHITPNPNPTFGTVHVATSHFFRYIIAAAFKVEAEAVKVCSLPRCDPLRADGAPDATREEVRALLGIPADQKLVLWMPTYRTEGVPTGAGIRSFLDDLPEGTLAALERACRASSSRLIVKLHPMDLLNDAPAPVQSPSIAWLRSQDWARHEVQLYDLIAASDALLSDVSSVLIDYLVTGRPAGILGFDPATYTRDLIYPIDYLLRSQRFDVLSGPDVIEAFFAKVRAGRTQAGPDNDVARIFYEDFPEPGDEALMWTVGL